MTELVLIRGLPGSGKSTMAKAMTTHTHVEADMFFTDELGNYEFHPEELTLAHRWCLMEADHFLRQGRNVVVSNTFTRMWEMQPYIDAANRVGADVRIIEATGTWPNVHGVPAEAVERMRNRWERVTPGDVE